MEKEIDGVKYKLTPIPPHASPYNVLVADLLMKKPETVEDAEKISSEIKKAMVKLFAETVTPTPKPEHHIQLFNALTELTTEVMKEAGLFRKNSRPNTAKGNPDSSSAAQEAQ